MESIYINKTKKTPLINLNFEDSIFQIEGPSFAEDIVEIYDPIFNWIDTKLIKLDKELICEFYFTVLNSASHKRIFQMLIKIDKLFSEGKKIKIKWCYDEDDEDVLEMGEDLVELVNVPFEFQPIE